MRDEIISKLEAICEELYNKKVNIELSRPEEKFGDFSCNVALKLASELGEKPRDIAEQISEKLRLEKTLKQVSVAGPGFINIALDDNYLLETAKNSTNIPKKHEGKTIVAEYSDPNPFKALHAGHLYTTLVGDSISSLLETSGAKVVRVNFGGDVGMHVAKAMWGIIAELGEEDPSALNNIPETKRADWVNDCYAKGHREFESNQKVESDIKELNKKIYKIHENDDRTSNFAKIYWTCRQWSYEGFDNLYKSLYVKKFDKYYPESSVDKLGFETIKNNIGIVYEESDGAVVFKAEKYGLFTQVFINSQGLTTYAGKDVGLILTKEEDYSPDISYIITDVSQKDHLAVVMKSIEQFKPKLVKKTIHQTHGRIKLPGGQKMSSRQGKVVMASDVLESAKKFAKNEDQEVLIGAIRYSFLRTKIGGDIIYDPKESISHEGNSGPYIQYALVRAKSIISKLTTSENNTDSKQDLDASERSLARKISMYSDAFTDSLEEYSPHHICNYLYELSQNFNRFYENSRVFGDEREALRGQLVVAYEEVLSHGLNVLGMPKPEKM